MKILHVIDTLGRGGAETLLVNAIRAMEHHKHCVAYCTPPEDMREELEGVPVLRLNHKPGVTSLPSLTTALRRVLRQEKADIIHTHTYWTSVAARFAAPSTVGVVNHYHFADYGARARMPGVRARMILDKFTCQERHHLAAVSAYVTGMLRRVHGPRASIHTVRNFVGEEFYEQPARAASWEQGTPLRLVSVGHLNPEKNYGLLIEAFAQLGNLHVSVDIWGDGPMRNKLEEAARVSPGLTFRGEAAGMQDLLPQYHAFIMPSMSEACPLAPIEAAATGLPLFLSSIPALREFGEGAAHFFPPHDATALAQMIRAVVEGELPLTINTVDYSTLLAHYSQAHFVDSLDAVYNAAYRCVAVS